MTAWQPIETAPRDSTPILLCLAVPSKMAVGAGTAPSVQVVAGDLNGPFSPYVTGPTGETVRVTHWMPLPDPPEDAGERRGTTA